MDAGTTLHSDPRPTRRLGHSEITPGTQGACSVRYVQQLNAASQVKCSRLVIRLCSTRLISTKMCAFPCSRRSCDSITRQQQQALLPQGGPVKLRRRMTDGVQLCSSFRSSPGISRRFSGSQALMSNGRPHIVRYLSLMRQRGRHAHEADCTCRPRPICNASACGGSQSCERRSSKTSSSGRASVPQLPVKLAWSAPTGHRGCRPCRS